MSGRRTGEKMAHPSEGVAGVSRKASSQYRGAWFEKREAAAAAAAVWRPHTPLTVPLNGFIQGEEAKLFLLSHTGPLEKESPVGERGPAPRPPGDLRRRRFPPAWHRSLYTGCPGRRLEGRRKQHMAPLLCKTKNRPVTRSRRGPPPLRGRVPAGAYPLRAPRRVLGLTAALAGELVGNVVAPDLGARQVDPRQALGALDHGPPRKGLQAEARDEVVRVVLGQGPAQPRLLFLLLPGSTFCFNETRQCSVPCFGRGCFSGLRLFHVADVLRHSKAAATLFGVPLDAVDTVRRAVGRTGRLVSQLFLLDALVVLVLENELAEGNEVLGGPLALSRRLAIGRWRSEAFAPEDQRLGSIHVSFHARPMRAGGERSLHCRLVQPKP